MRRRGVQIEITLLHILTMVAFRTRQTEESFLEDTVFAIPKRQREAQAALAITDSQQPVLTPSIRATAGMIMRKVIPTVAGL